VEHCTPLLQVIQCGTDWLFYIFTMTSVEVNKGWLHSFVWLFYGETSNNCAVVGFCKTQWLLLGFCGNSVQLLQWMISLITGSSATGCGGTRVMPAIMGLIGVRMPRLGSKPCIHIESGEGSRKSS